MKRFRTLTASALALVIAPVVVATASPAEATVYKLTNHTSRVMTVSELYGGLTGLAPGVTLTDAGGSWKIARGDWCRWHVVNGTSRYTPANGGYDVWVNYGNEVIDACGRL